MQNYCPEKIFINISVKNHWLTKKILNFYSQIPICTIDDSKEIEFNLNEKEDPINEGKKYLYITKNKGSFVKKCPGTNGFICCNYYVIDLIENCHLECSYCFLQNYLSEKVIKIYVNVENLFNELDTIFIDPNKFYRIGTGELSDSLALDEATNFSSLLINYFSSKKNVLLELKTKTNSINNLLNIKTKGETVISWSLNPDKIIQTDENKSSSLNERIDKAYQCQKNGYQLAFHFDPIIYYENWLADYKDLIDKLFAKVDSKRIAWISLGGFRYNPPLDKIIQKRFPTSQIIYQEFLESPDGKMRYFIKIREEIYKNMLKILLEKDPNLFIYLCMEGKYLWKRVFGFNPKNDNNLDKLFAKRQKLILKNI